jgi:predicted DNA-binding protein
MPSSAIREKARLNIQLPTEIKKKLSQASARQGKKVSVFVRESIEEKLMRIDRLAFEEQMKNAYQDLAEENLCVAEDFQYADAENLP